MAGIGFKIQKLLAEDTYWGMVKGYFFSAVISSGPWLISIICIGTLGMLFQPILGHQEHHVFRAWVTYCYAASLVISGATQVSLTRYISDLIFSKEDEGVFSSYVSYSLPTFFINTALAALYLGWHGHPWPFVYGGAILYAVINQIWIAMIYLSAAKDYFTIVLGYLLGGCMSVGGSYLLVEPYGLKGLVFGYTLGQLALLAILTSRIVIEFPKGKIFDGACFRYLWRHPNLLLIGFFYNGAIWVDKLMYWIFKGEKVASGLWASSFYETPTFLAFVTIVPTLSIFLVRIETSFYRAYKTYYNKVIEKYPLSEILKEKQKIKESLALSFYRLLIYQGTITALCVIFAPSIIAKFKMESFQLGVLRITILGAFVHAMLMVLMIIILYFDWKGLALKVNMLFFASNFGLTWYFIGFDVTWQGYGYFLSCVITFCFALWMFFRRWENLEFITFTSQPLGGLSWDENP